MKHLSHLRILVTSLAVACVVFYATGSRAEGNAKGERPNVVLILSDDVGWGDISCYQPSNVFKTPAIDRLASEGIRFTNAHAPNSVCTPTRYALLTGRYCWRTFVREGVLPGYSKPLIAPNRMTLATLLKQQGYATGAFGKWHLGMDWKPVHGDDPGDFHFGSQIQGSRAALAAISLRVDHTAPVKGGPIDVGFDAFFGTPSNCKRIPVFIRDDRVVGSPVRDKSGLMRDPEMRFDTVDDLYVDEAIKFIDSAVENKVPFFVYLALNAIHGAVDVPQKFKGKSGVSERADKCLWVNKSVERVCDALEASGQTDNTLVIFTSDNGPKAAPEELRMGHDASGPWRGFKTDVWEGGTRVPFIARWPGHIEPGSTSDNLLSLSDVLATLAAITGQSLPTWAGEDSFNQLPALLGDETSPARKSMITQSYTGILSIRLGKWKLILDTLGSGGLYRYSLEVQPHATMAPWRPDKSNTGQLYDLEQDLYETTNVFQEHPEVVQELKLLLWRQITSGRSRPLQ